jgi:transcriptional regulator with XRE-family HTH domain
MTIRDLQDQLRAHIRARIGRGELTGTILARNAGLPQGHLSNFLNARRGLSLESMDRLFAALGISILDLAKAASAQPQAVVRRKRQPTEPVAMVSAQNATLARFAASQILETRSFRRSFLRKMKARVADDRRHWLRFVLIKLDPRSSREIVPGAISATLLIDRHYSSLRPYRRVQPNLYLVKVADGCVAAYISVCENCLVLRRRTPRQEIEIVRIEHGRTYSDYIIGRICHIGLEL